MPVHGARMWGAIVVAIIVLTLVVFVAAGCRHYSSAPSPIVVTHTHVINPLVSHITKPPLHKRIAQKLLHRKH